jgi:hypothetical protein
MPTLSIWAREAFTTLHPATTPGEYAEAHTLSTLKASHSACNPRNSSPLSLAQLSPTPISTSLNQPRLKLFSFILSPSITVAINNSFGNSTCSVESSTDWDLGHETSCIYCSRCGERIVPVSIFAHRAAAHGVRPSFNQDYITQS